MATNKEERPARSASHHNAVRPATATILAPWAGGEGYTCDLVEYLLDTAIVF